jgi:hypothetical protein
MKVSMIDGVRMSWMTDVKEVAEIIVEWSEKAYVTRLIGVPMEASLRLTLADAMRLI